MGRNSLVDKMTYMEAYERIQHLGIDDLEDAGEIVRQCNQCGAWVSTYDYANEWTAPDGTSYYDICEDCKDCIENNEDIETFDNEMEEFSDFINADYLDEREEY